MCAEAYEPSDGRLEADRREDWRQRQSRSLLMASAAPAQEWWYSSRDGIPDVSIATSLPHNGDPGGYRKWLSQRGIVYGLEYTNDVLSNVRGGLRTGTIDQGKLQGILTVDFGKLAGWNGLSGFANFFQIHNTGRIRRDYVGGINTIAAIEAVPATRLSEVWLEQKFADDKASIRVGQLAADAEFFYSELSTMFLQSDWPTIAALNLPSGGPAYPLSTPGARLKIDPDQGRVAAAGGVQRRSGRTGSRGRRAAPQSPRPQFPRQRSAARASAKRNSGATWAIGIPASPPR